MGIIEPTNSGNKLPLLRCRICVTYWDRIPGFLEAGHGEAGWSEITVTDPRTAKAHIVPASHYGRAGALTALALYYSAVTDQLEVTAADLDQYIAAAESILADAAMQATIKMRRRLTGIRIRYPQGSPHFRDFAAKLSRPAVPAAAEYSPSSIPKTTPRSRHRLRKRPMPLEVPAA